MLNFISRIFIFYLAELYLFTFHSFCSVFREQRGKQTQRKKTQNQQQLSVLFGFPRFASSLSSPRSGSSSSCCAAAAAMKNRRDKWNREIDTSSVSAGAKVHILWLRPPKSPDTRRTGIKTFSFSYFFFFSQSERERKELSRGRGKN